LVVVFIIDLRILILLLYILLLHRFLNLPMILNSFQRFIELIHLAFQALNNNINVIALADFGELALRTEELADFGVYGMASEKLDSFVLQLDQLGFTAQEELH
jgi:hypothetical protein